MIARMTWTFVHINDTQPGSPRSYRFRPALLENEATAYAQVRELKPDLMLVGGDLTRDGTLHGYELDDAKRRLDTLGIPYRAIPGNMDVGNKHARVDGPMKNRRDTECNTTAEWLDAFAARFGELCWTFVHRNVRFTGFYEALAGSGLAHEREMWRFLESLATLPREPLHVVVNHYPLFIDSPDEKAWDITKREEYLEWYFSIDPPHRQRIFELLQRAGVTDVFSGHIHCRCPAVTFNSIRFWKTPATSFSQWVERFPEGDGTLGFYACHVDGATLTPVFVPLSRVSTDARGYGPGGHPPPHERDYSLAWEK